MTHADFSDNRLNTLLGIDLPIIQAPMTGATSPEMIIAVADAGGLGSLACAALDAAEIRDQVARIRHRTPGPINLNFFCHDQMELDPLSDARWRGQMRPYHQKLGLSAVSPTDGPAVRPFEETSCTLVEALRPDVVSFHFGLPDPQLMTRVKATGAKVIATATTVPEAIWLEARGCDAVIAQGLEAGGHRGMFLDSNIATQVGTFALVPQVVDAVAVPVIAAGGISDPRGVAAAMMLGASGVQVGTAYLFCPEARIAPIHRDALRHAATHQTALTNVFTGHPARSIVNRAVRELGPISRFAPPFPHAASAMSSLRCGLEKSGSSDFSPLWSGQAAPLAKVMGAGELTRHLFDAIPAARQVPQPVNADTGGLNGWREAGLRP